MYLHLLSFYDQIVYTLKYKAGTDVPEEGTIIIYKTEEGEESGRVLATARKTTAYEEKKNFEILRAASKADIQKIKQLNAKADNARTIFLNKVQEHGLEMFLANTRYSFDDTRIEFTFTAAERVDFRELVRSLARTLRRKIHLKQIGPRDRSKIVGGYGVCGRRVCCANFLLALKSVSMEAPRGQNLIHKSTEKLSGLCGKLRCCLNYELDLYNHLRKKFPAIGEKVKYKRQNAEILEIDYINDKMRLRVGDGEIVTVEAGEVKKK